MSANRTHSWSPLVGGQAGLLKGASVAVLGLFLTAGCSGAASSASDDNTRGVPASPPTPSSTNTAPPTGTGTATPPVPPPVAAIDCNAGPQPGVSPIRRMTPFEYDNTIRDLVDPAYEGSGLPVEGGAGFDNNAEVGAVSRLIAQKYMEAAEAVSAKAVADLPGLLGCDPGAGETPCIESFVSRFGYQAWRRPLATGEVQQMVAVFTTLRAALPLQESVRGVIESFLNSPHFLYRVETGEVGDAVALAPHQLAARLSYLLWNSMPDAALFAAADQGQLVTPAQVAEQARRMLGSPQAKKMVHRFQEQWWNYKDARTLEKDAAVFPEFTSAIAQLQAEEAARFLDYALFEADGTLTTLLTSPRTFVTPELAAFYGYPTPQGDGFSPVDDNRRSGLLSQGAFLASHAKADETAVVARGVFVRGGLFCQVPPPPPGNVNTQLPPRQQGLSTRKRLEQHRNDPACAACHELFDPLGFAFEHFNAVGKWRDMDEGVPVDASGELKGTDVDGPFTSVSDLAVRAAGSELVSSCMVTQWFRYAYGRQNSAMDVCSLNQLNTAFRTSGYKIPELIVALTQSDAFLYRNANTPAQGAQ